MARELLRGLSRFTVAVFSQQQLDRCGRRLCLGTIFVHNCFNCSTGKPKTIVIPGSTAAPVSGPHSSGCAAARCFGTNFHVVGYNHLFAAVAAGGSRSAIISQPTRDTNRKQGQRGGDARCSSARRDEIKEFVHVEESGARIQEPGGAGSAMR